MIFAAIFTSRPFPTRPPNCWPKPGFTPIACLSISSCRPKPGLKATLAPDKDGTRIRGAMTGMKAAIDDNKDARKHYADRRP